MKNASEKTSQTGRKLDLAAKSCKDTAINPVGKVYNKI